MFIPHPVGMKLRHTPSPDCFGGHSILFGDLAGVSHRPMRVDALAVELSVKISARVKKKKTREDSGEEELFLLVASLGFSQALGKACLGMAEQGQRRWQGYVRVCLAEWKCKEQGKVDRICLTSLPFHTLRQRRRKRGE